MVLCHRAISYGFPSFVTHYSNNLLCSSSKFSLAFPFVSAAAPFALPFISWALPAIS